MIGNQGVSTVVVIQTFVLAEAVFARCLSALKKERIIASKILPGPSKKKIDLITEKSSFTAKIGKVIPVTQYNY